MYRYQTYQFEFMPVGLIKSETAFQKMVDNILVNVSNIKFYIYFVVIHLAFEEEQLVHLETVMNL